MKAWWQVSSRYEDEWHVERREREEDARKTAEAWAKQGHDAFIAKVTSIYAPSAAVTDLV